jgi:C4-type Zn-finger protein
MAKTHYVECPVCGKEFYLETLLYQTVMSNPKQNLKCPFCKEDFYLHPHQDLLPPKRSSRVNKTMNKFGLSPEFWIGKV